MTDIRYNCIWIAGVIQKFEFVYELDIKILKRQLKRFSLNNLDIDSADFRDVLCLSMQYAKHHFSSNLNFALLTKTL